MGNPLPPSRIGPTMRTKMTDFTYDTYLTLKCKTFGASHRPEDKSCPKDKTIPISFGTLTYFDCKELFLLNK